MTARSDLQVESRSSHNLKNQLDCTSLEGVGHNASKFSIFLEAQRNVPNLPALG